MEGIWTQFLSPGISAQKAELIALTQALIMRKGLAVNIYSDSPYETAYVHGAMDQERGLLTAEGKTIKNKDEILQLLKALWLPKKKKKKKKKGNHSLPTVPKRNSTSG
jgi:ribonuclease HI